MRRMMSLLLVFGLVATIGGTGLAAQAARAATANSAAGVMNTSWNSNSSFWGIDLSPRIISSSFASLRMEGTVVTSNGGAFVCNIVTAVYLHSGVGPFGIT